MTDLYKDKSWLQDHYWNKEKSLRELSIVCECNISTIEYWMDKYNMPRRTRSEANQIRYDKIDKKYKDKDWLYDQYINKKKKRKEIAKECNSCIQVIDKWLRKLDVPKRIKINSDLNYRNKEWLEKELSYKSQQQIAKEENVSRTTIKYWIDRLNIKTEVRKFCKYCGEEFITNKYHLNQEYCQSCLSKKKKETRKDRKLKRIYGISLEEYEELLRKQNYVCVICGQKESRNDRKHLSVDHNHKTGRVRGLICDSCNKMIADSNENPLILINGAKYLNESR